MKLPRRALRTAMILIAAIAVLMGVIVALAPTFEDYALRGRSNCGGNSAALHDVQTYSLIVRTAAAESPDRRFAIETATAEQREWLSQIVDDPWVRPARFLVSPRPYQDRPPGPRKVLIICDTPYRNVPRRILGTASPTHAAAFSDGSVGLISIAEFEALDHASLVLLDELLAASTREGEGKGSSPRRALRD